MKLGWLSRLVSPGALLVSAALLAAGFGVCHAVGWRAYTCVLCGSLPAGVSAGAAIVGGGLYVLTYFATVVFAPILVLTAVLRLVSRRWLSPPAKP
jgi:hypothetical protein